MKTYVILLGQFYLYDMSGLTSIKKGTDPDKAKLFHHRERAENIARFLGGKIAERL